MSGLDKYGNPKDYNNPAFKLPRPKYGSGYDNLHTSIKGDGLSDLRQSSTNINYGFNINAETNFYRPNTVDKGYVFFTRPMLSLHSENLLRDSRLSSFLTTDVNSVHYYVKCLLDPRLCYDCSSEIPKGDGVKQKIYDSFQPEYFKTPPPMLDNQNPFLTLFSNTLKELNGWPDPRSSFFVTEPNLAGGQTVYVDSHNRERGVFDLSATFDNPQGNALVLALMLWRETQSLCWEGIMHPYPDFIFNNLIDYKTGIYRFTLDQYRKKVVMCAKTIGTLQAPDSSKLLNYSRTQSMVRDDQEINVNFKCEGADYNNPYIFIEFNLTLCIGNKEFQKLLHADIAGPEERDKLFKDDSFRLEKVPDNLKDYFNFRCYPWINLNDRTLEWYVSKDCKEYEYLTNNL